jgi:hypothetical protein
MRNRFILALLISSLLVTAGPAPAASASVAAKSSQTTQTTQAAFGRGFGRRAPSYSRPRYRSPSRYRTRSYRRPSFGVGRFVGGVLKVLGVAYLFHMLFGWGAGGSPFGLMILFVLIVLVLSRRRRRPTYY